jgi:hypothetical protein
MGWARFACDWDWDCDADEAWLCEVWLCMVPRNSFNPLNHLAPARATTNSFAPSALGALPEASFAPSALEGDTPLALRAEALVGVAA